MPNGPNVGFIRPEVSSRLQKWRLVDDTIEGEDAVKARGETYLPKPETHVDATLNEKIYGKYKTRAVFFPVAGRTLAGLCGQVFSKPVVVDVPETLKLLIDDIDGGGTTLEQHSKRTLEAALKKGRAGLLADFPRTSATDEVVTLADLQAGRVRPRVLFYTSNQIINWRETNIGGETVLSLLVLCEEKIIEDDGFETKSSPRWRVYKINPEAGGVTVAVWKKADDASDQVSYVVDEPEATVYGANQKPLPKIPWAWVGASNNDSTVDDSPMYPISQLNVAHYRNSADYEQNLFLVGQATPVFTGLTNEWVEKHIKGKVTLGASTPVSLPQGAAASLLQAQANSLPMEGMKHKEDQMKAIGAKLIEPGAVQRTATEAEIEQTSEASVLSSVAKNVSAAYELALRHCSAFVGEVAVADAVSVTLNSEFQISGLNAQERQEVMAAWQAGVLAWAEVREVYRRKNIATLDDDDARTIIEQEGVSFGSGENGADASGTDDTGTEGDTDDARDN